jgi:hypothetical protein
MGFSSSSEAPKHRATANNSGYPEFDDGPKPTPPGGASREVLPPSARSHSEQRHD